MAERKSPAASSRRDPRITDKAISAGKKNLAKGRAATEARRAAAKEAGLPTAGEVWAKLLDGTMTVKELDDAEIAHMRPRNKDGGFTGKTRRVPSHLQQAFQQEALTRAQNKFRTAVPEAVAELIQIGRDPDVANNDRIRALTYVIDRALGKTAETVRIEGASKFDQMSQEAIDIDRELQDLEDTNGK